MESAVEKFNAGIFIPNKNDNPSTHLLESALYQLRYLDNIGWFTNEVGYQRGSHRLKKLYDLCRKGEVDLVICYSKEDIVGCEKDLETMEKSIMKWSTVFYCIKECIKSRCDYLFVINCLTV